MRIRIRPITAFGVGLPSVRGFSQNVLPGNSFLLQMGLVKSAGWVHGEDGTA